MDRYATATTVLADQTVGAGDLVIASLAAANRDPAAYPDPDVYDVDRRPQGHLGFGAGKHFCLGSGMARLVTAVAMRRFLERVPEYRLADGRLVWNSSSNFRSPAALPFLRQ